MSTRLSKSRPNSLISTHQRWVLYFFVRVNYIRTKFRLCQVTFTLSEAAAERGMIDGAGQLYRKSRRGGSATLQQLPGVIFMPEGAAGVAGIFNSSSDTEANSDRGSTTEMRVTTQINSFLSRRMKRGGLMSTFLYRPRKSITGSVCRWAGSSLGPWVTLL